MQVPVLNINGEKIRDIEVDDAVFGVPFNEPLVHQVMVSQQANKRQGTANTKTRSQVSGSSRKLYRQKGTGNARAGNLRSPLRRHGGVVFGPHPRDFRQAIPKKMRQMALRCMLSDKLNGGNMIVVEPFTFEEPKTREMVNILEALGVGRSALVIDGKPEANFVKSARNIPDIKTLPANLLNVVDLLSYNTLVITETAVRQAEKLWGQPSPEEVQNESI
jgi:large subunit ribosomal protein L4